MNTSPLSGTQELLPVDQAIFNEFKDGIEKVFLSHGFLDIETPIIERSEILLAKAGGETEKQIYKVFKTAETADDADQALRFDHTVPLARYIVEHENDLAFPFSVSQIGKNFRGERAQKGRFREFYQCDVDVVGRNDLPVVYDAKVIATLFDTIDRMLKLPNLVVRVSNRKILNGLIENLGLSDKSADIFSIVDHAEKVSPEKTEAALREIGLNDENVVKITTFMGIKGDFEEVSQKLQSLGIENETFESGVSELGIVLNTLKQMKIKGNIIADMLIVRGLDYYTGTVFETFLEDHKELGSLCSGGRYENLAEYYTDQKLPGVGGSIGLSRLFYTMKANNLIDEKQKNPIDVAVVPISENEYPVAFGVAEQLYANGYATDVVLTNKKLGDKLSYATKIARNGIVIGENEVKEKKLTIKNFETGETHPFSVPGEPYFNA